MPSSISNSNDRLPDGPWGRTWLLTMVLFAALLVGVESYWRTQGQRTPQVVDDFDNWSLQRERVSTGGGDAVAVLGMSRVQLGFATQVFYERYPDHKLGIVCVQGLAPFATLRDLANDEDFRGIALVEITEPGILRMLHEDQQAYVDYFHDAWRWDKRIVRATANVIQSNLVTVSPTLRIRDLLTQAIEGDWPKPNYLRTFADRSRLADFSKADMDKLWQFLTNILVGDLREKGPGAMQKLPDSGAGWREDIAAYEKLVAKIQSRGGKVVFVRYPTSGQTQRFGDHFMPRDRFWDVFAASTSAVTIHYDDVPGLRGFATPDWSHLGEDDAVKFTNALLDELKKHGVLP